MSTAKAIGASNLQLPDPAENYSLPTLNTNFSTIADEVNKNVDGLGTPIASRIASGTTTLNLTSAQTNLTQVVTLPAGFTVAPIVVASININSAGRALMLSLMTYSISTTQFTVKLATSDGAAIGTSYAIIVNWVAIQ
jgi:hypothetical protein